LKRVSEPESRGAHNAERATHSMSAVPGLGSANLRLPPPDDPALPDPADITVDMAPDGDQPDIDEKGNILKITHGDGSVSVSLDGKPLGTTAANDVGPKEWFGNLVDDIAADELSRITEDLLRGIEDDLESRREWIEDRAQGIKLLGLKLEMPNVQGASDGAPVEGMSKVRHPLLLEAVLRFQANARSELLPTDGPVKIRNDSTSSDLSTDQLANALEQDMNHYLTAHATEYYPDTDRMLFMAGFGGDGFKKVYDCPLRNRPVSESVDADDLIVNQSATDLANAQRVTHRTMMKPSTVKRLQIMGVYRDVDLGDPILPQPDALQQEEKAQQGLKPDTMRLPQDREREIYECYCELNIVGFEHQIKGKDTGLQIPYIFTMDKSSRQCLAVTRNYDEDGQELPVAKKKFVKFPFVPGIGFYGIGLLHILGNTTNAVTAAWREMLDNGMFANFPGFLIAKSGTRQNTNIFRVPPGGGAQVDTGGMPIGQAVQPLPYETAHMAPLMQLVDNMAETGRRIGGTAEVQVGEGRADVPVGTVMAMIDQAIKVMNAVHKRMHAAQAEEFQLLKQLFKERPESFFARKCKSKTPWDRVKFLAALDNCDLVPQADPNTSSSGQRLMKVMALKQLQSASPNLYDPIKVDTAALAAIGWPNPEEFFVPPTARAAPPPQLQQMQAEMANKQKEAEAKATEAQARATEAQAKAAETSEKIKTGALAPKEDKAAPAAAQQVDTPVDQALAQAKLIDAHTKQREVAVREQEAATEDHNRDLDREAKLHERAIELAADVIRAPTTEAGGQVGVSNVGKKASKIIKDVDKGLK
jgi:hypothetical protein